MNNKLEFKDRSSRPEESCKSILCRILVNGTNEREFEYSIVNKKSYQSWEAMYFKNGMEWVELTKLFNIIESN